MNSISSSTPLVSGKLYLLTTPIGNRGDISQRALEILQTQLCFFAEDTRELKSLLMLYGIPMEGKKFYSFGKHNMKESLLQATRFLEQGDSIVLCTDRGVPGICDPGALLVHKAHELKATLIPIPGPSSVTTAISLAGFSDHAFYFFGFLPTTPSKRAHVFEIFDSLTCQICFFESASRLTETLQQLKNHFPTRELFIGREMTKKFESFHRFFLKDLDAQSIHLAGEYTLVLSPGTSTTSNPTEELEKEISLRLQGERDWSKTLGKKIGVSAKDVYNALQRAKQKEK